MKRQNIVWYFLVYCNKTIQYFVVNKHQTKKFKTVFLLLTSHKSYALNKHVKLILKLKHAQTPTKPTSKSNQQNKQMKNKIKRERRRRRSENRDKFIYYRRRVHVSFILHQKNIPKIHSFTFFFFAQQFLYYYFRSNESIFHF